MSPEPYYQDETITVYHGDCRDILPSITADALVTDPPYAVCKGGDMLGFVAPNFSSKGTHTRGYAEHHRESFLRLMSVSFALAYASLPPSATGIAFGGNRTLHQMVTEIENAGFSPLDLLVFTSHGMPKSKTTLAPRHEIASLFRKPGKPRQINPDWKRTNRFDFPRKKSRVPHLTPKQRSWMDAAVEIASDPGDVILDMFAGSGTTLLSARDNGRRAIGIERDEEHCELIVRRIQGDFAD